jgi:formylglycine-generating enzyme required for sulfatase activity
MKKTFFLILSMLSLCLADSATAQVTIGSLDEPQSFSVLELAGGGTRGFRLPQMTNAQRDALNLTGNDAARGLQIYNTCNGCVETWNGTKWIQDYPPGFLKPEMIEVAGGSFEFGSRLQTYDKTVSNPYTADIPSFKMSLTQVTQAQFEYVMGVNPSDCRCGGSADIRTYANKGNATSDLPVEMVNWYDAIAYCNKLSILEGKDICYTLNGFTTKQDWENLTYDNLTAIITDEDKQTVWDDAVCDFSKNGYRLPYEAEWEYAARGGLKSQSKKNPGADSYDYDHAGSNTICYVAWYTDNNHYSNDCAKPHHLVLGTKPVAHKLPNELGLFDMSGNVFEWCWSWHGEYNYTKPYGADTGSGRVLRGGGWYNSYDYCLVSVRHTAAPHSRADNHGFRVVASE